MPETAKSSVNVETANRSDGIIIAYTSRMATWYVNYRRIYII